MCLRQLCPIKARMLPVAAQADFDMHRLPVPQMRPIRTQAVERTLAEIQSSRDSPAAQQNKENLVRPWMATIVQLTFSTHMTASNRRDICCNRHFLNVPFLRLCKCRLYLTTRGYALPKRLIAGSKQHTVIRAMHGQGLQMW